MLVVSALVLPVCCCICFLSHDGTIYFIKCQNAFMWHKQYLLAFLNIYSSLYSSVLIILIEHLNLGCINTKTFHPFDKIIKFMFIERIISVSSSITLFINFHMIRIIFSIVKFCILTSEFSLILFNFSFFHIY